MPIPYKILISVLSLVATIAYFVASGDEGGPDRWVALALGPLMVAAIWIFPEANAREIRREAGKRQ